MENRLDQIVAKIADENALHVKKIRKNLKKLDGEYFNRAERFLHKYEGLLSSAGKDMSYAVDCYLRMIADMTFETVQFRETGKYSSSSFEEVNQRVYGNASIMEYYMH